MTTSDLSPEVADPDQGERQAASSNTRGQRILLWTTPPAAALFVLAYFLFPVFSPPLSPTLSPEQVAAFFRDNNTGILGVVILGNLIACSLVPLFAVTAVQMSRTATSSSVFTYAYVISVGVGTTAFILADYCWGMAAFRPERDPQLISLLNDMAWFFFIAPVGTIAVQSLCLAVSIYLDARPDPIFPGGLRTSTSRLPSFCFPARSRFCTRRARSPGTAQCRSACGSRCSRSTSR